MRWLGNSVTQSQMAKLRSGELLKCPYGSSALDDAIKLLTSNKSDDCIAILSQGFEHRDFRVRKMCVLALAEFKEDAIPALEIAIGHADRHVNCAAAAVLSKIGGSKATNLLIGVVKNADADSALRLNAVESLARIGRPETVDGLLEAVKQGREPDVGIALVALGKIGGSSIARELTDILSKHNFLDKPETENRIFLALANCGDPKALGPLVAAIAAATERDRKTYLEIESYCPSIKLAKGALPVLTGLVESHAGELGLDDLGAAAALPNLTYYDTKETDDGRFHRTAEHSIDFSRLRQLATDELRERKQRA